MRLIGHLANETTARTFGDFLFVQGIENRIEDQSPEGWAIWVNDEDKLEQAGRLLTEYRASPLDSKYQTQAKEAAGLRAEHEKGEEAYRKRLRGRRHLFKPLTTYGFGPLTFALIVVSVIVFILSNFGNDLQRVNDLFITGYSVSGGYIEWDSTLPEIRHGQLWRLITPIFIHMSALHILFNMLWLKDLGSMIEGRQSVLHLAGIVVVSAALSNLGQFYFGHMPNLSQLGHGLRLSYFAGAPNFGGMSGVVYALLGYVWLRGKFDPGSGLYLHPSTVIMMLVWLVACYSGIIGPIANGAHTAGLIVGMAWGFASSWRYR